MAHRCSFLHNTMVYNPSFIAGPQTHFFANCVCACVCVCACTGASACARVLSRQRRIERRIRHHWDDPLSILAVNQRGFSLVCSQTHPGLKCRLKEPFVLKWDPDSGLLCPVCSSEAFWANKEPLWGIDSISLYLLSAVVIVLITTMVGVVVIVWW